MNKLLKIVLKIILIHLPFINVVNAQHPTYLNISSDFTTKFEHYTTTAGISNNQCIKIFQDRYGFIWIGTSNGLNRFDGYNFIQYFHNPDDSTSISDNFISDITEDIFGNLWIATHNGLNRFNRGQEIFEHYKASPNGVSHNNIRKVLADSTGILWIETFDGILNRYDLRTKSFEYYQHSRIIQPFYHYYSIFQNIDGRLWLGGRNFGPCYFDEQKKSFHYIETSPDTQGKKRDSDVACYFQDSRNTFWISGIDGIYTFNQETEYFDKFLGSSTYSIIESKDGNIWFATGNGIYRYIYETQSLTHFKNDENNPFSINNNHVNDIFQDKDENIWVATDQGLSKLNFQQTLFGHLYHIPENKNSLASNKISSLTKDKNDNIWIGFKNKGFDKYNPESKEFEHFQNSSYPGLKSDYVSKLYFDSNDNLWIGLWRGVGFNIYNPGKKTFKHYAYDPHTKKRDWYADFLEDKNGTHWIGLWGASGLHKFELNTGIFLDETFIPLNRPKKMQINDLQFDLENNLWIGGKSRTIHKYNLMADIFSGFIHKHYPLKTNSHKNVRINKGNFNPFSEIIEMNRDESGHLWFITDQEIIHCQPSTNSFESYSNRKYEYINSEKQGAWFKDNDQLRFFNFEQKEFIHTTLECETAPIKQIVTTPNGDIYILNQNRLEKYQDTISIYTIKDSTTIANNIFIDSKKRIWLNTNTELVILDKNLTSLNIVPINKRLQGALIHTIYESSDNMIWLGTNHGLYQITNVENGNIEQYTFDEQKEYSIISNIIYTITEDNSNNIWLGTEIGLCKFERKSNRFILYNNPGNDALTSHLISFLFEDSKGGIWVGTTNQGLNKFNSTDGTFIHYTHQTYDSTSISSNTTHCIFEDSKNNIWIGTDDGLNVLDQNTNRFKRFYTIQGLADNSISSIQEDQKGYLWIGTENGLSKYNSHLDRFYNFSKSDGLQGNLFSNAACVLSDGRLVFGGDNGINIFDPEHINIRNITSDIQFTSLKIFHDVVKTDFTNTHTIHLNHRDNFFTIAFSALNFNNANKLTYHYILDKVDPNWNKISAEPQASYTDINPGTYTFMVKTTTASGEENSLKYLKIIISPPFWQIWWFYLAMASIFASVLAWILILRFKKYKAELATAEIEQRLLRTQMNPHFIFNALISIQNFIYSNDAGNADKFLTKFSRLLRLILQNSRSTYISIEDEIETITNYLELQKVRYSDIFAYKIDVDNNIDREIMLIPPMLAQPFIENSIEHGFIDKDQKYNITISILLDRDMIIYTIEDDGIGIRKSRKQKQYQEHSHKSLGMQITKDRILNLKRYQKQNVNLQVEELSDLDSRKQGTRVILSIPVKND